MDKDDIFVLEEDEDSVDATEESEYDNETDETESDTGETDEEMELEETEEDEVGTEEPEDETDIPEGSEDVAEDAPDADELEANAEESAKIINADLAELIGQRNPYTGELVKDVYDAQVLRMQADMESKGMDPALDFAKYIAAAERVKEAPHVNDLDAFTKKYPGIKVKQLRTDKQFMEYARTQKGANLLEAYDGYQNAQLTQEKKAAEKARQIAAKANASPGSLSGGQTTVQRSVDELSDAEFEILKRKALRGELKKGER